MNGWLLLQLHHALGKFPNGASPPNVAERMRSAKLLFNQCEYSYGVEGLTAEIKEIVSNAYFGYAENLLPDRLQPSLKSILRRHISRSLMSIGRCLQLGGLQGLAIDLAIFR